MFLVSSSLTCLQVQIASVATGYRKQCVLHHLLTDFDISTDQGNISNDEDFALTSKMQVAYSFLLISLVWVIFQRQRGNEVAVSGNALGQVACICGGVPHRGDLPAGDEVALVGAAELLLDDLQAASAGEESDDALGQAPIVIDAKIEVQMTGDLHHVHRVHPT